MVESGCRSEIARAADHERSQQTEGRFVADPGLRQHPGQGVARVRIRITEQA